LTEAFPDKLFIIQHMFSGKQMEEDWDEYIELFNKYEGVLILALNNVNDCLKAAEKGIPFYYGFPIQTYEEFNSLIAMEPFYIIPGAPLFFNLEYISKFEIPIKIFPNMNSLSLFPKIDSATGTWVRPEDIEYYGRFVETCEFITETIEQERALFRIYKSGEFIGPISLIIPDLEEYGAHNDLIDSQHTVIRTYCKQKCESGERDCHICENILKISNPDKLQYLLEK